MYNLKDLQRINEEIGENGRLRNQSSLEFALSIAKRNRSWLYELSYLMRSLLVDHAFVDGNKRTAYVLAMLYFEDNAREYDDQRLVGAVLTIARKNVADINRISRVLLRC